MSEFEQTLSRAHRGFVLKLILAAAVFLVILVAVFLALYFPRGVSVEVLPEEAGETAAYSIVEGRAMFLSNKAILISRQATANVSAPGFIAATVALSAGEKSVRVELQPVPARIVLTVEPALPDVEWIVDGKEAHVGKRLELEVMPGPVTVGIDHPHHEVETVRIEPRRGETVERHIDLTPVSRSLHVNSFPSGASVVLDGEKRGETPLTLDGLGGGSHELELSLTDHLPVRDSVRITNRDGDLVRDYLMQVKSATLEISVSPAGGELTVDGRTVSPSTPVGLVPGRQHIVHYRKDGYIPLTRQFTLDPGQRETVSLALSVETGQVTVRSVPSASVVLNGKPLGPTPQTLTLQTVEHTIILERPGYRQSEIRFTPDPKLPLLIDKTLEREAVAKLAESPEQATGPAGVTLKLFRPSGIRFTLGAPASEPGQRANEFLRDTVLDKPFYAGVTEVTNEQFDRFSGESSANPSHPKTGISWTEAARFCNWLSDQEKLERVYRLDSTGNVRGYNPRATGYRLISEAEWEWLARVAGRNRAHRFVWGDSVRIPDKTGNFADESGKGVLSRIIPNYDDGYSGVAPAGSFTPDPNGLYDLAGNVSEWVHDVYHLVPPAEGAVEVDPLGRQAGSSHVVKGSNFRTARVSEMRSSFREGLTEPRDDTGFRVARYIYGDEP